MTTNAPYKPSESKREEFRKYLEKNGVMDALTKVLVNLYEEAQKPEDALEFIRDKLAALAGLETYKEMSDKLQELEERCKQLEAQAGRSPSQLSARAPAMPAPEVAAARPSAAPSVRASAAAPPPEPVPAPEEPVVEEPPPAPEEPPAEPPAEEAAPPPEEAPAEEPQPPAPEAEAEAPPPEEG